MVKLNASWASLTLNIGIISLGAFEQSVSINKVISLVESGGTTKSFGYSNIRFSAFSIKNSIFLATLLSLFSILMVKLSLLLHFIVILSGILSIAMLDFLEYM